MKVLYWLGIGFDRHGPSVHLLKAMIEETLIEGHEVTMIVRNTGGVDPDVPIELQKYENLHCEVVKDRLQSKGKLVQRYFEDIAYFFRCKEILRKHKNTDTVFLQSCTAPIFPLLITKHILKKPVLFNVQNIFPIDALVLGKLSMRGPKGVAFRVFRKMQQRAYQEADRLVTISGDMKATLVREKAPVDRISVIYNWSYDDAENSITDDENLFLNAHPEVKDKFRVVFAGNLGAMVNAELIADAAIRLKSERQIQFIIIGDGNNMGYLRKVASEHQLENMSFYPYQPEEFARHNYAMADININALPKGIIDTCMPSKTATMLNSLRPMVVSVEKNSVYASILKQVDKCIVVDVDDAASFADGIMRLYRQGARQKSQNARTVFEKYCSCTNAKKYVRILESMAELNNERNL